MPSPERYALHSRMSSAPKITLLVSEMWKSLETNSRSKLRYNDGEGRRHLVEAPRIVDEEPFRIKAWGIYQQCSEGQNGLPAVRNVECSGISGFVIYTCFSAARLERELVKRLKISIRSKYIIML